nr:ATP-binding protein [Candidatus Chloroploca sp. Khr17]
MSVARALRSTPWLLRFERERRQKKSCSSIRNNIVRGLLRRAPSLDIVFCDTNPMTTYVFAKDYHGTAGPVLTRLAKEAEKRYDVFFLCDTDIPYADTWDRSGDQKRKWFQDQIDSYLMG